MYVPRLSSPRDKTVELQSLNCYKNWANFCEERIIFSGKGLHYSLPRRVRREP